MAGSLNDTVAIVNLLKSVNNPIITVALGSCVSAAAMIFSCGQHRYIGDDICYMIHQPYSPGGVVNLNYSKIVDSTTIYKRDLDIYIKHITSNGATIPVEKINYVTKEGKDLYLTSSECRKYKIATHKFSSYKALFKNEKINLEEQIYSYESLDETEDLEDEEEGG